MYNIDVHKSTIEIADIRHSIYINISELNSFISELIDIRNSIKDGE